MDDDPKFRITPLQQVAASCTGAILTSFLVTPLDVVKIRLQAQQKSASAANKCFLYCNGLMDHYCGCGPETTSKQWFQRPGHFNGTIDAFVKISRSEGMSSLWSGLGPTLVLAIPSTVLYFVSYEQIRIRLKERYHRSGEGKKTKSDFMPYWIPLVSGASARVIAVTVVSPLELIRTKMQSQRTGYLEIGEYIRASVRQSGVASLWKGVTSTLFRDVPFSAIYWMNYETIKRFFGAETPSFGVSFFAGALSGMVAATFTVPFDVVKTHQQIEFGEKDLYSAKPHKTTPLTEIVRQIYRQNGYRGLFAGLAPRLIKVAPACAIMISSFEYGKVFFYRYNQSLDENPTYHRNAADYYHEDYYPPEF